jgi:hypothetical protein
MGKATRLRKKNFLDEHPFCIFCGGSVRATTVEHCPPRAMFQHRHWPEAFEFPACAACNHGSSDSDALVAMLARMDPFTSQGDRDGALIGLMKNVNSQYPGLFQKMMPSAVEARKSNRELGLKPHAGQTHQETGAVKVTPEMNQAVQIFARKLSKAIYYLDSKKPFPNDGCLLLNWFTNADFIRDGRYAIFELLQGIAGVTPELKRSGKFLNDQFEYKLAIDANKNVFIVQALFGKAFGWVVFGSASAGVLEPIVEKLRQDTEKQGPFAVLQSTQLQI